MIFIIVLLGFFEDTAPALVVGVIWIVLLAICYYGIQYLDKDGRWALKNKRPPEL